MGAINLVATMDAVAAQLIAAAVTRRVYAYPEDTVSVPCAIVGYPTRIDFDATYARGSDEVDLPVWFVVGMVTKRATRAALSAILTGATGIKNALDGNLGGVVQTCRVEDCVVETVTISGVNYMSARFDLNILT